MNKYLLSIFLAVFSILGFISIVNSEFIGAYNTITLTTGTATSTGVEAVYNAITIYNPSASYGIDIATNSVSPASKRFAVGPGMNYTVSTSTHVFIFAEHASHTTVYYTIER